MDRINGLGVLVDANGHNIFQDENLAAGIDGTDVEGVWLTGVQEEIQALQALDGYAPIAGDNGQMLAALTAKFPGLLAAGRSAGTPGWIKLPGGLILQWVRNHTVNTDSTGTAVNTWVFPIPFTSVVVAYSYVNTNESAGEATNAQTGTIRATQPTLTQHSIIHLGAMPSAQVAFSGFILGA